MFNLKSVTGLALSLQDDCSLVFGEGLVPIEPEVRNGEVLKPVLPYVDAVAAIEEFYYIYRGISSIEHQELFNNYNLRYDITILKPGKIAGEYVKTLGHYHPVKPGTSFTYGEVYQVLHGQAGYLLQAEGKAADEIEDVVFIRATVGDIILIPPGYGHITMNLGTSPLVMANLVYAQLVADYQLFLQFHGGAYYVKPSSGGDWFVKNLSYGFVPAIRHLWPMLRGESIYSQCIAKPQKFMYLSEPEQFARFNCTNSLQLAK
jgi:glucose-6-phosphate isomerase